MTDTTQKSVPHASVTAFGMVMTLLTMVFIFFGTVVYHLAGIFGIFIAFAFYASFFAMFLGVGFFIYKNPFKIGFFKLADKKTQKGKYLLQRVSMVAFFIGSFSGWYKMGQLVCPVLFGG